MSTQTRPVRSCHLRTIDTCTCSTQRQHRYLRDGIRAQARFHGGILKEIDEADALTLALAWHAAYWRDRADRQQARNRDRETGDLFDEGMFETEETQRWPASGTSGTGTSASAL